jgi:hypothetical protein
MRPIILKPIVWAFASVLIFLRGRKVRTIELKNRSVWLRGGATVALAAVYVRLGDMPEMKNARVSEQH